MKIGFFPLMFLVFMTLKLTNTIAWSWWLVALPLWGPLAIAFVIWIIITALAVLFSAFN